LPVSLTLLPQPDGRQSQAALMIARGIGRLCYGLGWTALPELPLRSGRRADLVSVTPKGEIVIFEIKSSAADLRADSKWPDYRMHCDRLFFATSQEVPVGLFPSDAGLCIADGYGAEILRDAPSHPLPSATRKEMLIRLARVAANRLQRLTDPERDHGQRRFPSIRPRLASDRPSSRSSCLRWPWARCFPCRLLAG
jgi:hypothetical protein